MEFESGTYWLNVYTNKKNFLNIACTDILNSTNSSYTGIKIMDDMKWKTTECNPYFIVSSSKLIETYDDFNNRFSIFNVNLSNSS